MKGIIGTKREPLNTDAMQPMQCRSQARYGRGCERTAKGRAESQACPRFGRAPRGYLLHSPPGNSLTPVRATRHPTRRRGDRRQTYPSTTRSATTCKEI